MNSQEKVEHNRTVIKLTEPAILEAKRRLQEAKEEAIGLRLGVKGGGCSGLSYIIDFGKKREGDYISKEYGFDVYVDKKSALYLKDSFLDYEGGFMGSGFKFKNPNAGNTCGCGESFSV